MTNIGHRIRPTQLSDEVRDSQWEGCDLLQSNRYGNLHVMGKSGRIFAEIESWAHRGAIILSVRSIGYALQICKIWVSRQPAMPPVRADIPGHRISGSRRLPGSGSTSTAPASRMPPIDIRRPIPTARAPGASTSRAMPTR